MANSQHETAAAILEAALFAAEKHRNCRRKDEDETPYINHPIKVAHLLADVGGINDIEMLQAALLHDTVEDTETIPEEIELAFGRAVRELVIEVTDDKSLEKQARKRRQIEKAPHLSSRAKMIKIADKIANLTDVMESPPDDWDQERRRGYVEWANAVVNGCKGKNDALDNLYAVVSAKAAQKLA